MQKLPPVTIIVLNWNTGAYIEQCLKALTALDYPDFSIVVVDNDSSDDSLRLVENHYPDVQLIQNNSNLGYAAGNNVAIRQSNKPFVAIVNPDVFVDPGWLLAQIDIMTADDTVGITGSKLCYPGGNVIQHAGGFVIYPRATTGHHGLLEEDKGQWEKIEDVDYVIGAAWLIRRELLDLVGLLGEDYFLYFEDVDMCYRAQRAGYRVVYVPGATGIHVESAASQPGSGLYLYRFHRSRWRFLIKNHDIDTLIAETLPAEKEWIGQLGSMERRALYRAFSTLERELPVIFDSRASDSTIAPATEQQQQAMLITLGQLRKQAMKKGLFSLSELSAFVRRKWVGF